MFVWCGQRKEMVRCGVADVFDVVCGVCAVSSWVAGGMFTGMPGTMRGGVRFGEEGESMYTDLLLAMTQNG